MTTDALKVIADAMEELNINYEFGEWSSEIISYPYFVGEYIEGVPTSEDGRQETDFKLTGFSRTTWLSLEEAKGNIETYFNRYSGVATIAPSGNAVVVMYGNAIIVPTGDAQLKRIEITLKIIEWKVN